MLALRHTVLALLLGTALVGCSAGTSSTATGKPASSASSPVHPSQAAGSEPADTGRAIPDGSYAKTATAADAKALGLTDHKFLSSLGSDGKTTFTFKFQGDRYTHFVVEKAPEPGDVGTLTYDAKRNAVMTSASEGCPGCVYTYRWSLIGDKLALKIVGQDSTDSPRDVLIVRFVTEGTFMKQS
jgi:hypothetical protein